MKKNRSATVLVTVIMIAVIFTEPVLAGEELGSELDGIDWINILESFGKFVSNLFKESGSIVSEGVDNLIKLINKSW